MSEAAHISVPATNAEAGSGLSGSDLASFDRIADIARREAGLVLPRDKAPMVAARVAKRMRRLSLADLAAYCAFIDSPDGADERREMIYSLTTNVTSFMREAHHFEFLGRNLLPGIARRARNGERIRIWSAGCSTGQEPYTIAMAVLAALPEAPKLDIRILATDIDRHVLAEAHKGQYSASLSNPLPEAWRRSYLSASGKVEDGEPKLSVSRDVRDLVAFRELNLLREWPMQGKFDIIFCRNVVIYFDRETQSKLWRRFCDVLIDGGHLILGHSERIDAVNAERFRTVGTTIYQRAEGPGPAHSGVR